MKNLKLITMLMTVFLSILTIQAQTYTESYEKGLLTIVGDETRKPISTGGHTIEINISNKKIIIKPHNKNLYDNSYSILNTEKTEEGEVYHLKEKYSNAEGKIIVYYDNTMSFFITRLGLTYKYYFFN